MVFAVNRFEPAEGEVGVDLRGGDVGVAEEGLDGAEVGSALDHVGSAAVAELVGAGGGVAGFDEAPDPTAAERLAALGKEEARRGLAGEPGASVFQIGVESLDGSAAEGNDALLVAFAADESAAGVEGEVGDAETGELGDAKAGGVEQFEDSAVAEGDGVGLGMAGGECGVLEHGVDFRDGEGFGKDLPRRGRFQVESGIAVDAFVEEEPAEEAAKAGKLAGGGTGFDAVSGEVLEEAGDVGLSGLGQRRGLDALGELEQVALVGLAGERAEAFFDVEVGEVFADEGEIAGFGGTCRVSLRHPSIIGLAAGGG